MAWDRAAVAPYEPLPSSGMAWRPWSVRLGAAWTAAMRGCGDDGNTVFTGPVADQAQLHGVLARFPGFLASFFLHVPFGVSYITTLNAEEGLTRGDIIKGAAYTAGFAVVAIGGPNVLGSKKNSPYAFTPAQMGPHDVQSA